MSGKNTELNLYAFWDEHYRIEDDELRVMIADAVISMIDAAERGRARLTVRKYRHPMTRRKLGRTRYSILDILADFIMRPVQKAERCVEYPVKNADAEWYAEHKRRNREISYDSFTAGGGHIDIDGNVYLPKGNKSEDDA